MVQRKTFEKNKNSKKNKKVIFYFFLNASLFCLFSTKKNIPKGMFKKKNLPKKNNCSVQNNTSNIFAL